MAPQAAVVPLSYSLRAAQLQTAGEIRKWWEWASQGVFGGLWPMSAGNWTRDNQVFYDPTGMNFTVKFNWRGFTPESGITYGPATATSENEVQIPGATYMIDNRQNTSEVPFQQSVTVTYAQSASAELDKSIEIDTGVNVGLTVGNNNTPAKLETAISTALKIAASTKDVSSWNQGRSETQTIGPVKVQGGHALLAEITSPQVRLTQSMIVNGWMDTSVELSWLNVYPVGIRHDQGWRADTWPTTDPGNWVPWILYHASLAHDDGTRTTVTFPSIDDFVAFLDGTNVDVGAGVDRDNGSQFGDPIEAASKVVWHGTVTREVERSSDYKFTDIAPDQVQATIDKLALPDDRVVDLSAQGS